MLNNLVRCSKRTYCWKSLWFTCASKDFQRLLSMQFVQNKSFWTFYCAFYKNILHFLNPNTALKNEMNNWTKWRIFTWYPGVRFMLSFAYSVAWFIHLSLFFEYAHMNRSHEMPINFKTGFFYGDCRLMIDLCNMCRHAHVCGGMGFWSASAQALRRTMCIHQILRWGVLENINQRCFLLLSDGRVILHKSMPWIRK